MKCPFKLFYKKIQLYPKIISLVKPTSNQIKLYQATSGERRGFKEEKSRFFFY